MIRLEEQFGFRAEANEGGRQALKELLEVRSRAYRKAFKSCRKKFSEHSVHALRVEIRRILSALGLVAAAVPHETIVTLESELRDRLKALSRLRDTQVQIDSTANIVKDEPQLKPFHGWLRKRERRLIKRLKSELAEARPRRTARRIARLSCALRERTNRSNDRQDLRARLVGATGRAFETVLARYRQAGPRDLAMIHRIRIAFKKFRYMVEALSGIMPGISDRQVRAMQAYQKSMGKIQDVEVLLARLEKFVKRESVTEGLLSSFRRNLLSRRASLVKRFLASADRLLEFWPVQPRSPSPLQRRVRAGITTAEGRESFGRMSS